MSVVTVYELEFGARRRGGSEKLMRIIEAFLANVEILPFEIVAARRAGEIRARLEAVGRPIGSYDLLIAGHALASDAILVTHNVREFSRVPELRLEDWVDEV